MIPMSITNNIPALVSEMKGMGSLFMKKADKAVMEAAKEYMKDCIKEIDALIYKQPASSSYPKRTKNLRRSHHLRRITSGVFMVFNDSDYAEAQHDGWHDRGGVWHVGRPWMETALRTNEKKYEKIIDDEMSDMFV